MSNDTSVMRAMDISRKRKLRAIIGAFITIIENDMRPIKIIEIAAIFEV